MSNEEKKTREPDWASGSAAEEERNDVPLPDEDWLWEDDSQDPWDDPQDPWDDPQDSWDDPQGSRDDELDEEDEAEGLDDLGSRRWEEFREEGEERASRRSMKETGMKEDSASPDGQDAESTGEEAPPDDLDSEEDDFEDRISQAMEKIVQDTLDGSEDGEEEEDAEPAGYGEYVQEEEPEDAAARARRQNRSARPGRVSYVHVDDEEMQIPLTNTKKKHKGLKITATAAAMLVVCAGSAYAGASYYYADKFFEGTTINGIDCSGMTPYEAEQAIASQVENYSIQVASRNLDPQVIEGSRINYRYLSNGDILKLLKQQKPYEWIKGFFDPAAYTAAENVTFDRQKLQSEILALNCAKEENQVEPENAYVAFHDTEFEIVPETEGSKLDFRSAYQLLDAAISDKEMTMDFTSTPEAYVQAAVTSEDPDLKATMDACNNFTNARITYTFGDEKVTLDGDTIKDWLQFDEKGQFVQNDTSFMQHVKEYVAQLAETYDTVNTTREFYTTNGRTVYVYGSAYGWKIDQDAEAAELLSEIQSGARIEREPVYSMTANARGHNDLGNTYIEVDMGIQHMYYYQNGGLIFESDIVSGNMSYEDRQTPPGIFTLYWKKSPDVLRGGLNPDGTYDYEQPVNYWMPFNGGIGFHDADWQPYFGGDRYLYGGSHGCINLPPSNAAILYDIIQYGVPIICFY